MSQQRRSFTQIIQDRSRKGDVVEFELNTEDRHLKPMLKKLFMYMQFELEDIPNDFKFYLYIPIVKEQHTSILPHKFYVRMTTPDDKTLMSWRFDVYLDSRKLHNSRFNKTPVKHNEMRNVEHEIKSSQQYSKFVREHLKPRKSQI